MFIKEVCFLNWKIIKFCGTTFCGCLIFCKFRGTYFLELWPKSRIIAEITKINAAKNCSAKISALKVIPFAFCSFYSSFAIWRPKKSVKKHTINRMCKTNIKNTTNTLKILQTNNLFEEKVNIKSNINSLSNSFIASLKKKIQYI